MDSLTNEQLKQVVEEISKEELKKYNLNAKILLLTKEEYYDEKTVLNHEKLPKLLNNAAGYSNKNDNTIIIFSGLKNRRFVQYIITTYHEIRHEYQKTINKYSYVKFIRDLEQFRTKRLEMTDDISFSNLLKHLADAISYFGDYNVNHDKYSFEIGADLYAIQNTKKYLKQNYPDEYEKEKEYLDLKLKRARFYYMTYDAANLIEINVKKIKELIESNKNIVNTKELLDKISPVLGIFLTEDLKYKKISEIINDESFKKLDKRIVYAFFSSKTFLDTLNMDELTAEEINILQESLEYTNKLYKNQYKMLSQELEIEEGYIIEMLFQKREIEEEINSIREKTEKISKKILTIYLYSVKKGLDIISPMRRELQRKKHAKSIPKKLEKVKKLNNQKTKGYITINILYIMSLLLSISTIIYLIFK